MIFLQTSLLLISSAVAGTLFFEPPLPIPDLPHENMAFKISAQISEFKKAVIIVEGIDSHVNLAYKVARCETNSGSTVVMAIFPHKKRGPSPVYGALAIQAESVGPENGRCVFGREDGQETLIFEYEITRNGDIQGMSFSTVVATPIELLPER